MQNNNAFQADAYQRAMDHMFEQAPSNPQSVIQFRTAGSICPVPPLMNSQEWANKALNGAQLKKEYAAVPVSGLFLLRDSLVRNFARAN